MNLGLFEITLLVGSVATALAGVVAALTRRRSAALLALNSVFAACFGYFFIQGLRFGGPIVLALGPIAGVHVAVASSMVTRARRTAPTA